MWRVDASTGMAEWKRVAHLAAASADSPALCLVHRGYANQIRGYRLYYMLQYAKQAGVKHLVLDTDGLFWIDEATDWLAESGVDRIELTTSNGRLLDTLADRIARLRRVVPVVVLHSSLLTLHSLSSDPARPPATSATPWMVRR
jgi:hypothetical protein